MNTVVLELRMPEFYNQGIDKTNERLKEY